MEEVVKSSILMNQEGEKSEMMQLVTFELAGEIFGIDILKVQEISPMTKITRVPNAPHYVEGVINLRGKVIPVVDLRKILNLDLKGYDANTRIIVLHIEGKVIGILVDKMSEVIWVNKNSIETNPTQTDSKVSEGYIVGVVNLEDRLVILLDLYKVFNIQAEQKN
ncbi:MAG: Positive regulator of CheA protein activity (CheW) [Candidatus Kapaibacterium sp.]|nr:MAG: Positive regulator of CheA protein activity (CheW) [Candidatus Kapabacteria bacterium]